MKNINELTSSLGLGNQIKLEDIPDIDLYMDQVIQLFENKFGATKRNDEEKVLTKTMINNYAKGKLLFPIKKKKYSKEHILLISLIYQLKGALSINDIKVMLSGINSKLEEGSFNLEEFYHSYLELAEQNVTSFKEDVKERAAEAEQKVMDSVQKDNDYLERLLLASSLVQISNLYRKAAEKLVDQIAEGDLSKKG